MHFAPVINYGLPPPRWGGSPRVGEDPETDPPHESDWWISTGDALDYAEWLARRIERYHQAVLAWMLAPELAGRPTEYLARAELVSKWLTDSDWPAWRNRWLAYVQELREAWDGWQLFGPVVQGALDPRVNSWYTIRDRWHREFLEHAKSSKDIGGPDAGGARLPVDPLEQPGGGLGLPSLPDVSSAVSDVGWGLGFLALGVAAVLAVKGLR